MRNNFLALVSIGLPLAFMMIGCAPGITVEGGSNQNQPGTTQPGSPSSNPYSPETPKPSNGAPSNVVVPGGPGPCNDPELHVVGIYDPYNFATDTQGPATVHIDRPGQVKLFLSSYSATNWTVTAGPATNIVEIVAHSYESVTVDAPAGVPVKTLDFANTGNFLGCGYEYPDKDPTSGCETPELLAAVEQQMGQKVVSFHGCYAASDFKIGANLVSSSNCAVDMGYAHTSMVSTSCATPPPVPPNSTDVCAGKTEAAHYEGYFCNASMYSPSTPFLTTENISCNDARANCALNAEANPGLSLQCLWNGEVVFLAGAQSSSCGP